MYLAEMQKRKRPILCYSEFRAKALVRQTISAINALYFVHRAPYGGEDSTLYVIYMYLYIYIYVFICVFIFRLVQNPNLTNSFQPLFHRRLVGDLSIFYRYFHGHCSQEIRDIIPVPLKRFRTTRSSTHAHFSMFHCLLHEVYPTNRLSSQEVQFMEGLTFFFLSRILQLILFQI